MFSTTPFYMYLLSKYMIIRINRSARPNVYLAYVHPFMSSCSIALKLLLAYIETNLQTKAGVAIYEHTSSSK